MVFDTVDWLSPRRYSRRSYPTNHRMLFMEEAIKTIQVGYNTIPRMRVLAESDAEAI